MVVPDGRGCRLQWDGAMSDTIEQYSKHAHRKDLTFRQAEDDPLPKMLAYGELDRELPHATLGSVLSFSAGPDF